MNENTQNIDVTYMDRAFELSRKGYGSVAPNPYVGAIIVKEGRIIGEGFHAVNGGKHAEIEALHSATESVVGATLYVTLEPCCHAGRTGACTEAIIQSGIRTVVSAMEDPYPKVAGKGHQALRNHNISVTTNVGRDTAESINRIFIMNQQKNRAFICLKAALSLDGKLASQTGDSQWITGEEARCYAHYLRGLYDAILIGKGTLLSDNPTLNVRYGFQTQSPARIVVINDFSGIHPHFALFNTEIADTFIFHNQAAPPPFSLRQALMAQGVQFVSLVSTDPKEMVNAVYDRGWCSLMIEGGAKMYNAFINAALVDEFALFYGPRLIGHHHSPELWRESSVTLLKDAPELTITQHKRLGESFYIQAFKRG